MAGAKRKYIEAAYELLARDGLEGVSIRKVAEEVGCSSAALYRHFPDIDKLIAVASIRFLSDYFEDARVLSKVDLNPLELNLQLWECLAYYSFHNADVFEKLFFSDTTGKLYSEAVTEYFTNYSEDLMGMKDFMFDMFMYSTITERDSILLDRAVEGGMLSQENAKYLCSVDTYLYHGMLATLRGRKLAEEDFREATKEFVQLIIHSYRTHLEQGFSVLVVDPNFDAGYANSHLDVKSAYRVRIISINGDDFKEGRARATA